MERTSKHRHRRCFNALAQQLMDAITCHDVSLAAENFGRGLLHIHQFEKAKPAFFIVEEEINVGPIARLVTRCRAEEVKMLDAKPLKLRFMLPQSGNGFGTLH